MNNTSTTTNNNNSCYACFSMGFEPFTVTLKRLTTKAAGETGDMEQKSQRPAASPCTDHCSPASHTVP